jgi:hypothetical protein
MVGVTGSIPVAPTRFRREFKRLSASPFVEQGDVREPEAYRKQVTLGRRVRPLHSEVREERNDPPELRMQLVREGQQG